MCPDVGDKQVSPVSCEHEAGASDKFNDKIPPSEDISDKAPSSKEITDKAPYSEDITDKSSSSEDIIDNAPSSEDITDKVPSKEDIIDEAPSSETLNYDDAASIQNEDRLTDQFDKAKTQNILAESNNTAQVPNLPSSHKSSPDP